jgi:exo-beta-1,3-glucanase (GH17 family)
VFWGVAYGPYRADQTPDGGPQPTFDQLRADMSRLASLGGRIRTYSVTGALAQIPSLTEQAGLRAWPGAWIGTDLTSNSAEVDGLITAGSQPGTEAVIVGNEALLRGDVTPDALIAYIRRVKAQVSVPVGYCDTWSVLEQHPEVVREVDVILANIHPFWDQVAVADAPGYVMRRFQELKTQYPTTRVVIGETGWPSSGSYVGAAVAGASSQRTFFDGMQQLAKQHSEVEWFAFDAFDEPYKQEQNVGQHWGLLNADGSAKRGLAGLIPGFVADPGRLTAAASVITTGQVALGLSSGCTTSSGRSDWLIPRGTYLEAAYPPGQDWGAAYITVGPASSDPAQRGTRDYSDYQYLVVELRGAVGGEDVGIGVKTDTDPDSGQEPIYTAANLTTDWQTISIPLSALIREPTYAGSRFTTLYVVCEFVFGSGSPSESVFVRNLRFAQSAN